MDQLVQPDVFGEEAEMVWLALFGDEGNVAEPVRDGVLVQLTKDALLDWVNFRDHPLDFCTVCAKKEHMADDCRVPQDRQEWDKLLKDLNLTPRQNQGSGRGGRGGG